MKKYIYILILIFTALLKIEIYSANPVKNWYIYKTPEEAGWSSVKLKDAWKLYEKMNASAVMVIYDGNVLLSYGDVNRRFLIHSLRKSIISALYGIQVDKGGIDINTTLEDLNIDERDSLTEKEKQAKISDLLKARSGIYIPAANETESMKNSRPKRGEHKPGEYWYYNNWDFNTLGFILEQETGKSVFEDFKQQLAEPLQMEDFRLTDGFYNYEENASQYPAYLLKMSARDLARFGLLYLNDGRWNGKEIIKESWIKESLFPYTEMTGSSNFTGYGYLWWLSKPFHEQGTYCASGLGGQYIFIMPKANLVFVFRANTYEGKYIYDSLRLKFMDLILKSKTKKTKPKPQLIPLNVSKLPVSKLKLKYKDLKLYEGKYLFHYNKDSIVTEVKILGQGLILQNSMFGKTQLYAQSMNKFILEDIGWWLEFKCKKGKKPNSIIIYMGAGKKKTKLIGKPVK